jgi:hypothetical protein
MVARNGVTRIIASTSAIFSASADTTVRKWLPIASSSQLHSSFQFPGDAVELLRLSLGQASAAKAPAPAAAGAGVSGARVVGVADQVVAPTVLKAAEDSGSEAHDNSMSGVNVLNKHTDKVCLVILMMTLMYCSDVVCVLISVGRFTV